MAEGRDSQRLEQAADPALLDVDDAAGIERERRAGIVEIVDRLIEAKRRDQLTLQGRVLDDVAVGEGLLDHRQLEGIEFTQERRVLDPVVAIGIRHQGNLRKLAAQGAQPFHILAAHDLDLDAVVRAAKRFLHCRQQLGDRIP